MPQRDMFFFIAFQYEKLLKDYYEKLNFSIRVGTIIGKIAAQKMFSLLFVLVSDI